MAFRALPWARAISTRVIASRTITVSSPAAMGEVQIAIESKLREAFEPAHLDVINESYMHNVPKGSESHFKVVVVAPGFDGQALLARHRAVNAVLSDELAGPVHALSIVAKTPQQWEASGGVISSSPNCMGGSKR